MANPQDYFAVRRWGRALTLAASAARVASGNGDAVFCGDLTRLVVLLSITASATAAGDTADIYIDFSPDGVTWINGCHFEQQAGNGAAVKRVAVFDVSAPGTATLAVTADAAAGAVRPAVFGQYVRVRWVLVDGGGGDTSHTFVVTAWGQ